MYALRFLALIPSNLGLAILFVYRKLISPLYGQVCRYYPSCSKYAVEAYQRRNFFVATYLTGYRLLRCNPWSDGGVDEISLQETRKVKITKHGFLVPTTRKPE